MRGTHLGVHTKTDIAGGGVRVFSIRTTGKDVKILGPSVGEPLTRHCALSLRETSDLQKEILLRPTFFQHYNRAVIDWKYIDRRDTERLKEEGEWLKRQQVRISVDLASGINLFPDLRIVNNDPSIYEASIQKIRSIIAKMKLIGADELLLSSMRPIENNFTSEKFDASLIETYRKLADFAKEEGITVVFRPLSGTVHSDVEGSLKVVRDVNKDNFVYAVSLPMLAADREHLQQDLSLLQAAGVGRVFVSGYQKDINDKVVNYNYPLAKTASKAELLHILSSLHGSSYYLDGLYQNENEEYDDGKIIP
ncbi:MAG: sugar phosphate isomerase/epimerase [Prevotella sp.]|nr:sugar phosphate isomerase/epimerase [Prevotella sp.]